MGSWHVLQGSSPLSGVSWTDSPGDIWFASIYIGFALRLSHDYGTDWFFALAVLSGLSHLVQANITDYYKTLHLYFISKDKGSEFQSLEQVEAKHKEMKYGINKFFYFLYRWYTMLQVKLRLPYRVCYKICTRSMGIIFRRISVWTFVNRVVINALHRLVDL